MMEDNIVDDKVTYAMTTRNMKSVQYLLRYIIFIRPSFDGRIMVWLCPSVRSVVHNPCGQDIARTIWPRMLKLSVYSLYGQRKKPIYFQGHWAFRKNSGTWILVGRI